MCKYSSWQNTNPSLIPSEREHGKTKGKEEDDKEEGRESQSERCENMLMLTGAVCIRRL